MDRVRNGRVIIDNKVRDIMLYSNGGFVFNYSKYLTALDNWNTFCMDSETIGHTALEPRLQQNVALLDKLVGFENYNASNSNPRRYELVQKNFDILSNVNMVYAHPSLEDILFQLDVLSLTPFYMADNFNLESTGEKIPMEVMHRVEGLHSGRTAAFEQPILLDGETYLLEVKGVNYGDMPINLDKEWNDRRDCPGGLTKGGMDHSVRILKYLNTHGYDSTILVAAYQIPGLRQLDGQDLGVYVRAVKCSPSIAHYSENLPEVAESLGWPKERLAEYIIRSATRDIAAIWKLGLVHDGPVHEQNIRIGSITDFTDSDYVLKLGFNGVVHDTSSLVFSCQNIMEKMLSQSEESHNDAITLDSEKAEQSVYETQKRQAEHYQNARAIITSELNKQLGLNLPPLIGTASLAAEIYNMQRQLGLTNPNEKITVEYDVVHRARSEIGGILLQLFGKEPKETIKHLQMEDLLIH